MIPKVIIDSVDTFPSRHLAGDSWSGFTIGPLFTNVEEVNAFAAAFIAKVSFRDRDGNVCYNLDSRQGSVYGQPTGFYENDGGIVSIVRDDTQGNITILDAVNWEIGIDSQLLELDAGWYKWDVEVVDILGMVRTLIKGNLRVVGDTTDNILNKENYED